MTTGLGYAKAVGPRCPMGGRGVWVPAFAGTTWSFAAASRERITRASSNHRFHFSNSHAVRRHGFAIPAPARGFCIEHSALSEIRGRRECRARDAPAASRAKCKKHTSKVTTVTPETPGIPRAMVLTVSFVLSPVIGLSCHRRLANTSAKLDASVETSGPHDFAVRVSAIRHERTRVHRIPPRVDDVAQHPSVGQDGGSSRSDLPDARSKIFLLQGLDR